MMGFQSEQTFMNYMALGKSITHGNLNSTSRAHG